MTTSCRIITPGGRTVDLMAPNPEEFDESDIATLLARSLVKYIPTRGPLSEAEFILEIARAMPVDLRFATLVGFGASAYFPALPEEMLDMPFMSVFCEVRRSFIQAMWETFCGVEYSEALDEDRFYRELMRAQTNVHDTFWKVYGTKQGKAAGGHTNNPMPNALGRTEPWPTKKAKRNFLQAWRRWGRALAKRQGQ